MARNIFLLDGHPSRPPEDGGAAPAQFRRGGDMPAPGFGRGLTEAYARGLDAAGAEVRHFRVAEMSYDPDLHYGYAREQALEPDLAAAQEAIAQADHLVFSFPVWWGGLPAKMKGFFDRVFLPGFAYRYHEHGAGWDRLLTGRSARLLIAMTSPPLFYRLVYGAPAHKQVERAILGFCGVGPIDIETYGGLSLVQDRQRHVWLDKAFDLGVKDARRAAPEAAPALGRT